jgi:hypothetical protein
MAHQHEEAFKLHSPEFAELNKKIDRRDFLRRTAAGLGAVALGSLMVLGLPKLRLGSCRIGLGRRMRDTGSAVVARAL